MTQASDLDAIVAALARLRGRGRPPFGHGGPGSHERGGPPHVHEGHHHHHGHAGHGDDGSHGEAFGRGPHAHVGGGPARLRLLEALAAAQQPLSVSALGEAIGVDQPRASRLTQQAVELGLVRREADSDDARRTRIALTESGARLARGFRGERRERLQTALADFAPGERAELARLLTKLAEAWPDA